MLYFSVLYCIILLYCIVLYSILFYCIVLLYCIVLCCIVFYYCIVLYLYRGGHNDTLHRCSGTSGDTIQKLTWLASLRRTQSLPVES